MAQVSQEENEFPVPLPPLNPTTQVILYVKGSPNPGGPWLWPH